MRLIKTDRFLEFYTLGFKDELLESNLPDEIWLKKAYHLGKKHAKEGNDVSTIEFLNDDIVAFLLEKDDISRG